MADIDLAKVEQAKLYKSLGYSYKKMAKELCVSERTVFRYVNREDPEDIADELRSKRREKHLIAVDSLDTIMYGMYDIVIERMKTEPEKITTKDAMVAGSIAFDKLQILNRPETTTVATETTTFILKQVGDNGDSAGVISDSDALSLIEGEVQSDGGGSGGGEDLLTLPGSCEDLDRDAGDVGDGGRIDLPEPEGLCTPDDSEGIMAEASC